MTDTNSLLSHALHWSGFLRRLHETRSDWLIEQCTTIHTPLTSDMIDEWFATLCQTHQDTDQPYLSTDSCKIVLRRLRERVFVQLMLRDLNRLAPLSEVFTCISYLADLSVQQAYKTVANELAVNHGIPMTAEGTPQEMIIIAMGKLGGRELNVSSDIDLIMLYGENGETTGRRPLSNHEFYGRVTQRMMPLLSDFDAYGHVFRTDLRLRPDGDAGPPAWSLAALERYLIEQGREWERYAWIKARPIHVQAFDHSMPQAQLQQLEQIRRPFVYRKYFDFDALAALRHLREQIRQDLNRRHHASPKDTEADNIKLGEGGIREVEFVVQLEQLIRGGRHPSLQTPSLYQSLMEQIKLKLIKPHDADALLKAYEFLRQLEHVLQYREDEQTHQLPATAELQLTLAQHLGYPDYAAFLNELNHHRDVVKLLFNNAFRQAPSHSQAIDHGLNNGLETQAEHLVSVAPDMSDKVEQFLDSKRVRGLSENSQTRLKQLIPKAIHACQQTPMPEQALTRLLDFVETIAQRSAYLALLAEYPDALIRLVRILESSEWAAQYLTKHPVLLDELLDPEALLSPTDFVFIKTQLMNDLATCVFPSDVTTLASSPVIDIERQMDLMRETQHQVIFQLLAQDLEGMLTVEKLGDDLSLLADIMIEVSIQCIWPTIRGAFDGPPQFAVIAYGKLGGKELGYESDLDLVFLYDDDRDNAGEIYAKLARKISTWMQSQTSAGRLYELDLRLRPDGDAGLLVSTIDAFERYQRTQAWVWEHQALTRARFVTGPVSIEQRFQEIRDQIILKLEDTQSLRSEIIKMRKRIYESHQHQSLDFDIKHDAGGMVDVEFVTQYLVLAFANKHPELLNNFGNIALLNMAAQAGLLSKETAQQGADAYRQLRKEQHALRLQRVSKTRVSGDKLAAEKKAVIQLWTEVFNDPWWN